MPDYMIALTKVCAFTIALLLSLVGLLVLLGEPKGPFYKEPVYQKPACEVPAK